MTSGETPQGFTSPSDYASMEDNNYAAGGARHAMPVVVSQGGAVLYDVETPSQVQSTTSTDMDGYTANQRAILAGASDLRAKIS